MDEVEHPALELELGVERGVERHGDSVVGRDRPALEPSPLHEHLVRVELMTGDAEAAASELLELPRLERSSHRAELLAELRAEHGQVRLHASSVDVDVAELDVLDAQLLRDLVHVRVASVVPLHDDPPQRLAMLEP